MLAVLLSCVIYHNNILQNTRKFLIYITYVYSSLFFSLAHGTENHIAITFRTSQSDGLILWMNKGTNKRGDYLAIVIENGYVQLSYDLGNETQLLSLRSHNKINDNIWHTLIIER